MKAGEKKVASALIVPRDKIIFPPLHFKLGLVKQFVKALDKEGQCSEKLKQGVFDGPEKKFTKESNAGNYLLLLSTTILGNHKSQDVD